MNRALQNLSQIINPNFFERKIKAKFNSISFGLAGIILSACGRGIDPDESGTNLLPTQYDDTLRGSSEIDSITALSGNDTIYGFGGNDQILAGDGNDIIWW